MEEFSFSSTLLHVGSLLVIEIKSDFVSAQHREDSSTTFFTPSSSF